MAADARAARAIRVAIPRVLMSPGGWGRSIAGAAHRRHPPGSVRVVAELVPQTPDVDVDGSVEHLGLFRSPDRVEELVAGEHSPVRLEEGLEDAELDVGQLDEL